MSLVLKHNIYVIVVCDQVTVALSSLGLHPQGSIKGCILGHSPVTCVISSVDEQDCFLQKEARVCVSNAFVKEDSKFIYLFIFFCGRWASDRGSRCANVNIVVEWEGMLAEGTVVWND